MIFKKVEGSFRDPSGFLFWKDNYLYRQINESYRKDYSYLMSSGLYQDLINKDLLIPHREIEDTAFSDYYKLISPELIPFISYPYEWSFSQLKDAALLTLEIQKLALSYGMVLKDASAYNIQFKNGKPIFIDTLSFEIYKEGSPWVAYKQFCQHFLAPLALIAFKDFRLNQLLRVFIDGVPLDLASSVLPIYTYLKPSILLHMHLHAKTQKRYENKDISKDINKRKVSGNSLKFLVDSLFSAVNKLKWKAVGTEWVDYYDGDSYTEQGFNNKKCIVKEFLDIVKPKKVWDLGANNGVFSRIAMEQGAQVVSFDIDAACVDNNYNCAKKKDDKNLLPLVLDLVNPSAGIGWDNIERLSVPDRGPADLVMGLALIHHLSISNNVPFKKIAEFFRKLGKHMIIEFVPKQDKKVQKLLLTRKDIFEDYIEECFEEEFGAFFDIEMKMPIEDSLRTLYLMKRKKIYKNV